MKTLYEGEAIYLRSNYSSKQGASTITLQVGESPSILEMFEGHEGKRYMIALVEIGNDEQPTKTKPYKKENQVGPLCSLANRWCAEPQFWEFLTAVYTLPNGLIVDSVESAKKAVCILCGVTSRKELDTIPKAGSWFDTYIRRDYMTWKEHQEVVA